MLLEAQVTMTTAPVQVLLRFLVYQLLKVSSPKAIHSEGATFHLSVKVNTHNSRT
jgi:hypothetical protein